MTKAREECINYIEYWATFIPKSANDILEVGIAGDEPPGGNYYLFSDKNYQTLDCDSRYKPNIVADITKTGLQDDLYDVIILSNVIEHVFDYKSAIDECYRLLRTGGCLIVDCPWVYPYHAEDDFDDYWRISASCFKKLLSKFSKVDAMQGDYVSSAIGVK